jgi:hypothetical protein
MESDRDALIRILRSQAKKSDVEWREGERVGGGHWIEIGDYSGGIEVYFDKKGRVVSLDVMFEYNSGCGCDCDG